jgi:excinuclease UvrABC nuclease subunit
MRQLLSGEIPRRPGAYRFLGKEGAVLYVGKAEHLRDRVRSYFIPSATHSRRIRQALRQVESIQWEELETPLEAVVREQELILEHRPPCNVRGRRPESYVYLRAAMSKGTLRLQHSRRQPAVSLECTESGDPSVPLSISVGPFRGPARVKAGLELLRRCYPLARCTRGKAAEGCIYLQTGRCLAPCTGDPERIEQHNRLVTDVLSWLAHPEGPHEIDPLTAAGAALRRLSSAQRFEEAESVRSATEDLTALRESYRALSEATDLYLAVLFPQAGSNDSFPSHVRVNVVWGGSLVRAFSVSAATASLEISRVARSLDPPKPRGLFVAVTRERLDALLAVRRWLLDSPSHEVIRFQEPIENEEGRQLWARATASRALELLAGLP